MIDGPKSYYNTSESISPDHWFEPVQVWEVKAADLSVSPVYPAAAGIVSHCCQRYSISYMSSVDYLPIINN